MHRIIYTSCIYWADLRNLHLFHICFRSLKKLLYCFFFYFINFSPEFMNFFPVLSVFSAVL